MEVLLVTVVFLPFLVPVAMLLGGWLIGGVRERSHLRALDERESALRDQVLVTQLKSPPPGTGTQLVVGQAVMASDYFKTFTASMRALFGGEIRSYQPVMERARRQALVRALDQAVAAGADHVVNVRFTTTQIGRMAVEVFCYGTAVHTARPASGSSPWPAPDQMGQTTS